MQLIKYYCNLIPFSQTASNQMFLESKGVMVFDRQDLSLLLVIVKRASCEQRPYTDRAVLVKSNNAAVL